MEIITFFFFCYLYLYKYFQGLSYFVEPIIAMFF